jgi:hypothetical protein
MPPSGIDKPPCPVASAVGAFKKIVAAEATSNNASRIWIGFLTRFFILGPPEALPLRGV